MRKALAIALLLASTPAIAADDAVTATPGSGLIMHSKDIGALKQQPFVGLGNDTGASIIGAGTTVPVSGSVGQLGAPWTVNPGTPPSWGIGAFGSAPPANGVAAGFVGTADGFLHTGRVDAAFNLLAAVLDGNDATQGAKGDGVCGSDTGTCSVVALMKRINQNLSGPIPAGSNPIGTVTIANANNNGRAASSASSPVVPSAAPTTYHLATNTAGTNLSFHAGATTLFSCQLGQTTSSAGFFKIFNKASNPTLGTDTPVITLIIPGPSSGGSGSNVVFGPGGVTLTNGFAVATVGGLLDTDSSNGPAGITANCQYE